MTLEASGIVVTAGGRQIVDGAALTLRSGEMVGLIGPNGAGKSTLLRAALGLRPRSGGDVNLDGEPLDRMHPRARARKIAFLPQDRRVEWRLTAEQVVMLGRYPHRTGFGGPSAACRAATDAALGAVDARQLAGRPFSVLSGGERTRVLLARALAVEAPLLIADEPVAALDPYHQLHVMEILRALAGSGTGVLVVVHDLALAGRFMDRLILMDGGSVVREGKPAEILTPHLIAAVYGVNILSAERDGASWVLPWSRVAAPAASGYASGKERNSRRNNGEDVP